MAKDAFGNELMVGDRVVYNLSGEMAVGEIQAIRTTQGMRGNLPYHEYHHNVVVSREKVAGGRKYFNSPNATVRNTNGIVRIDAL